MSEIKSLEQVKEFHAMFEHSIGVDENHIEPLTTRQLRIKLLFEELAELAVASDVNGTFYDLCIEAQSELQFKNHDGNKVDKVEELDAIADIQYVLNGKLLTSGLHNLIDEANDLVHKNNMTKAHKDIYHAQQTIEKKNMINCTEKFKDGLVLLYNSDGKLTKPWDHTKVSLETLFKKDLES